VLGGIIADTLGWRWIFFARIPVALVVLVVFFLVVPDDRPARAGQRFDFGGATTLFFALSTLLLGVTQGQAWGWTSAPVLGLIGGSLLLFAAFVRVEMRAPQPMLPMSVFRNRLFSTASASAMLNFCGASASFFVMPFLLVQGLLMAPSRAGLLLVPQMFAMFVMAPITGTLSDRFGSRVLAPVGGVLTGLALLALSRLTPDATELDVVWRSALLGVGMATFNSPNNSAIMGSVPRSQVGLAGGTMSLMRNLGNVLGVAVAATVLTAREALHAVELAAAGVSAPALASQALVGGARDALLVGALIAFAGVGVSLVRGGAPVAVAVPVGGRAGASAER
jgi:predicted MFS family arabinose efflux permease